MNTIQVTHLSTSTSKVVGTPFKADLFTYMAANRDNGFDWDKALTSFLNGESYTTLNQPYGNIKLDLVK